MRATVGGECEGGVRGGKRRKTGCPRCLGASPRHDHDPVSGDDAGACVGGSLLAGQAGDDRTCVRRRGPEVPDHVPRGSRRGPRLRASWPAVLPGQLGHERGRTAARPEYRLDRARRAARPIPIAYRSSRCWPRASAVPEHVEDAAIFRWARPSRPIAQIAGIEMTFFGEVPNRLKFALKVGQALAPARLLGNV